MPIPPSTTAATALPNNGAGCARQSLGWSAFWPLLIATLVFIASSRSHVVAPGITRVDDKIVHFAVYGLLATLVCRAGQGGWRGAVCSLVIVSAYGASDEWHQSFVPGRRCEFADWVADTLGAALAIGLYAGWPRYRRLLEAPLGRRRVEERTAEL